MQKKNPVVDSLIIIKNEIINMNEHADTQTIRIFII